MSLKSSPVPRNPRITRSTGAADMSDVTTQSVLRKVDRASFVDTHTVSASQTPYVEVQSHGTYAPSDAIIPFNFDINERLLNMESGQAKERTGTQADFFGEDDIHSLQKDLIDYVKSLDSSLRSLFVHEDENMIEVLQQTRDVPVTHLFFQTQKEMRQLLGEDSSAKDRECIQRLSELLEE